MRSGQSDNGREIFGRLKIKYLGKNDTDVNYTAPIWRRLPTGSPNPEELQGKRKDVLKGVQRRFLSKLRPEEETASGETRVCSEPNGPEDSHSVCARGPGGSASVVPEMSRWSARVFVPGTDSPRESPYVADAEGC
ncbi:uncharacterized protein LOC128263931 [Drosophila gunungcola]|uniref:uncharacterized protein LOC128263931 n=1 Tax=Drosophila gunungcola TaxID=103775 RepID=UPI0022E51F23|nr:uncharacterized protein LOC128263931 [Drosophila gunungcola]XP_052855167.1 uncharacterized protein LOC128263931 [Drosophila gunungcola]XP_052855168.1 uncharacterized protein LOC128263931 [Drosophila gunungcola]XP_052855169.1 uncharacterized protein LOC128263931 [Drosophila gunungcola]